MRIFCVYQEPDLASSRIRVLQMCPHLEARGFTCEVEAYPRTLSGLAALCRRTRHADLVWLQKRLPSLPHAFLWRSVRPPLVFDFDDAIRFRSEPRRGSYRSVTRERRFRRIARIADAFTCGNSYLASLVPSPGDKPTAIYPSPVPTDVPRREYGLPRPRRVLGWIGERRNLARLARIAPQLAEVAKKHPLVLRVVSNERFDSPGLAVENVAWSLDGQERALGDLDVGLMPIDARSPFDLGKCSYKVLQYMAAGVVPVADAAGMNVEVITDRRDGRLVPRPEAWASVLDELLASGDDEFRMLAAGGRTTVTRFGYTEAARMLGAFFRDVHAASVSPR